MTTIRCCAALAAVLLTNCSSDETSPRGPQADGGDAAVGPETGAPEAAPPDAAVEAGLHDRAAAPLGRYPANLSDTGLFTDVAAETLAPGVRPFQPKYTLWSDGATKRRWVSLPAGETIDTSDMDFWTYPVGTKVWKEFTRDGKRIETRMIHKVGPDTGDWVLIAYAWNDDLTDAYAVPDGVSNARGTEHDIPAEGDCLVCHGNMKDRLLGVTAIQLSHDLPGVKITDLIAEGALSAPPAGPFTLPGSAVAQAALGYLHANCGTCHNAQSSVHSFVSMELWERTGSLGSVEETTAYTTAVGQRNAYSSLLTIEPGLPDASALFQRMSSRAGNQMPPLATELVDPTGVAQVRAWIESLPLRLDAGSSDAGTPEAGALPDAGGATDGG